jgi:hypothetical protein
MLLEDTLESNYFYCQQNIVVPFLIYNAVLLYPETDNILGVSIAILKYEENLSFLVIVSSDFDRNLFCINVSLLQQ